MKRQKKFIKKSIVYIMVLVILTINPRYSRSSENELSSGIGNHSIISPHQKNI
jgi:hypothetical protein